MVGSIVPIGSLAVDLSRRSGFPIITVLVIYAIAISGSNDNHLVRTIESSNVEKQISLDDAIDQWDSQFDDPLNSPMVLVNSAGGGLSAAYWTGIVLGELEEKIPEFHNHIFAISGVSGGSVGAVFYNAAIINSLNQNSIEGKVQFSDKLLNAIGKDYLAPTAASMLFPDLVQRFVPGTFLPDRAEALEKAFEKGFHSEYKNQPNGCTLSDGYRGLWSKECLPQNKGNNNWLPLLFINGTHQETGKRIITSPVKILQNVFLDSYDFFTLNNDKKIPLSTAAHNSARFTYVTPAGTILNDNSPNHNSGHIIDGGYFENFGAESLRDLVSRLRQKNTTEQKRNIIIISISNDTSVSRSSYTSDNSGHERPDLKVFLNEALAPLRGLLNTRSARGTLALKALWRDFDNSAEDKLCDDSIGCAFFNLERIMEEADSKAIKHDAPLGWVLSEKSKLFMHCSLIEEVPDYAEVCDDVALIREKNQMALDKIVNIFEHR